jgi:hypothetical protein
MKYFIITITVLYLMASVPILVSSLAAETPAPENPPTNPICNSCMCNMDLCI